jgi:hypothetical protein
MDDLQDRVLDLQLAVGEELVPALTDFIDTGLDVVDVAGKINQRFKQLTGVGIVDALSGADTAVDGLSRAFDGNNNSVDRLLGGKEVKQTEVTANGIQALARLHLGSLTQSSGRNRPRLGPTLKLPCNTHRHAGNSLRLCSLGLNVGLREDPIAKHRRGDGHGRPTDGQQE